MKIIQADAHERLAVLLPALYQVADAAEREQLGALLELISGQADALRKQTMQLWDDFFIETAQRWVIPYIGELVGNAPLHDLDLTQASRTAESLFVDLKRADQERPDLRPPGAIRTRSDVAKTIYYRRRKGTPAMLEEVARDVTGWGAHVVEFFTLLRWNQHLEHLRMDSHRHPDLRRVDVGDRVGGPWDTTAHTVDVRRINEWDGWYNLPNVGFFLWRLKAFRLTRVLPRAIGLTTWRLTFSPLGQDTPLFSAGTREPGESRLANELTVQAPIRAAAFFEDLPRPPQPAQPPPPTVVTTAYYGDPTNASTYASLVVLSNGNPVNASDVECANLKDWANFTAQPNGTRILIDVTRGRLAVPAGRANERITVSYYYGFSAAMGGGEYDRRRWLAAPVTQQVTGGGDALANALAVAGTSRVIEIRDDLTYFLGNIALGLKETLTIQASNEKRPHLRLGRNPNGTAIVGANGVSAITGGPGASLTLNGLLVEGGLLLDGDFSAIRILHSTLVPGQSVEQEAATPSPSCPSLVVAPTTGINTDLQVQIAFSVVGSLRMPSHVRKLWLLDSIVDGIEKKGDDPTVAVADAANTSGPPAHIERSTLLGASRFLKLEMASESIFTGTVRVDQQQDGCVRFSFLPIDSVTPQKYRCQPTFEIEREQANATGAAKAAVESIVASWLVPSFESIHYGRPGFGQLRLSCPIQIRTGAEDGSEMGAFCVLKQPQRESNLRIRLDEYLPVGLEAGIVYVT